MGQIRVDSYDVQVHTGSADRYWAFEIKGLCAHFVFESLYRSLLSDRIV